ncbi:MAG TPA: competence type IV pilus assembly protein ComGB [Bacillales bacterium]|nr:competence type IV pilus assembly protein ComGB [Bacillales bacterium]
MLNKYFLKRRRWTYHGKAEFLQRLGKLLEQGYTLSEGITFLTYHQPEHVRSILAEVAQQLKQGESFHEVLEDNGFPKDVLGYLFFSEQYGDLAFALKESGTLMIRRCETKKRFFRLVRYPLFLLWMVGLLIVFMMQFLFPQFDSIYGSLDVELPWLTRSFLSFIHTLPTLLIFACLLACFLLLYYWTHFRKLHPHAQLTFLGRVPLLKQWIPLVVSQYFCVQLGHLLKGGLSIYEALSVFENQHHLLFFQQEATNMKASLRDGQELKDVLRKNRFYVPELSQIIAFGQRNGDLPRELFAYGRLLMTLIETRMARAMGVLQPLLFAGVGIVVLVMYVSILLPIFHLLDAM